ncbi:MAG: rhodanese-like domain-containing protein, partial [Verrucomicrobiia bacterium]
MRPNDITPHELKDMMASDTPPLLIDCREQDEWELNRIAGAVHVPLSAFAERVGSHLESAGTIVIYCHHGMRSQRACLYLT